MTKTSSQSYASSALARLERRPFGTTEATPLGSTRDGPLTESIHQELRDWIWCAVVGHGAVLGAEARPPLRLVSQGCFPMGCPA
jgi:hypothetical protein